MDGYDEASSDFEQAYGEDSSYDRAIQIYETYLEKDMEADGTRYLEAALSSEARIQMTCVTAAGSIVIWRTTGMPKQS